MNALWVVLVTSVRRTAVDRAGLVFSVGFYALVVTVLAALWRLAAQASGGAVVGYSAAALTWYVVASEAAAVSLDARLIQATGDEIGGGDVATELLRPASVLWIRVAGHLGRVLPRLACFAVVGSAIGFVTVGSPPRPATVILAVPSVVLASACNVIGQHAFAGTAFWLRDAGAAWFLYHKFVFLLGGMLLPLQVLPDAVRDVALVLPFAAMAYAPARLLSGHLEPGLLLLQIGWLAAVAFVAQRVFAAGERRLQMAGG